MKLRDVLKPNPKCERCGVCCKSCICPEGKAGKTGKCIYLKKKGNLHSCELFEKGKINPDKMGLDKGCVLRRDPELFKQYKELYGGR